MPKHKVPSVLKIRFKVTKTGKVLRRAQNMRHLRRKKPKNAIRASRIPREVTGKMATKIRRMMGMKSKKQKAKSKKR